MPVVSFVDLIVESWPAVSRKQRNPIMWKEIMALKITDRVPPLRIKKMRRCMSHVAKIKAASSLDFRHGGRQSTVFEALDILEDWPRLRISDFALLYLVFMGS